MKISSISDVHVVEENDNRGIVLKNFLSNSTVQSSDIIIFLGDVFDFMYGERDFYIKRYENFFLMIDQFLENKNKKFIFIEGNHDFHVESILTNRFQHRKNFVYSSKGLTLEIESLKIHYCHGDEIEIGNPKYQAFRKIIRSDLFKNLSRGFFSKGYLDRMRNLVAGRSRKYFGEYPEEKRNYLKEKFRCSALLHAENFDLDAIVCGHSHIDDHLVGPDFNFINNGFSSLTKKFVYFNDGQFSLKNI